ncbi:MAG: NB-ARC domain-containing protein [Chloroflexi bacterium]|nr:NB-ARC domain-containing protein [Chloroflexota bacterium]
MPADLEGTLGRYLQSSHYSAGQLAALSGVPKRTIINWLTGRVSKPHQWQAVVQVAAALKLEEMEANQLLGAAGYPPIAQLRGTAATQYQPLLAPWPATAAPFQAIPALPYFVGREELIAQLSDSFIAAHPLATYHLYGMGGVGKTSLAAHLAYRLRAYFPDGVLWAQVDATNTLTILSQFAMSYGENVRQYPDVESRATAVRAILAHKRFLMVLDNVENSGQLRPLLPPTTGHAAVLVTSRHQLAALDGLPRFRVNSFAPHSGESLALFRQLLGRKRAEEWEPLLVGVADCLGHLPLALTIAAGQLHGRTTRQAQAYTQRIQQAGHTLDALTDEDRSVRLSLGESYHALPLELRRFMVALGALEAADFSPRAAAIMAKVLPSTAAQYLHLLSQRSLVQPAPEGRYSLHPLLRAFVGEQMEAKSPLPLRRAQPWPPPAYSLPPWPNSPTALLYTGQGYCP